MMGLSVMHRIDYMVLTLCGLLLAGSPVWALEFTADVSRR